MQQEKNIGILLYSSRHDHWVESLMSWLDENEHRAALTSCRTPEDLREALLLSGDGRSIIILRVTGAEELEDLALLRRQLTRGRVVVVHGRLDEKARGALYNLNPRFVGHEEQDLLALYQVLAHMMDVGGR